MEFANTTLPQYPIQDQPHFVEFLNGIYTDVTTANAIKHISFAPFGDEVGPITSLVARFTWDTTVSPVTVKPIYGRELSNAVREGLKLNGFEKWLVRALHQAHEVGEDIQLDAIPKDQLFLLHAFAITPCKNITMLTVPSQWYAHTDEAVKEELQECFPELNVRLRESNEDRTLVRIGGLENYSAPPAATPVQSVDEDLLRRPRCLRCKQKKKSCDRKRPCERCHLAGLGFDDCIPEDTRFSRNGFYGGKHTKGRWRPQTPDTEAYQDDVDVNATGDDVNQAPEPEQETVPGTADDGDDTAAETDTGNVFFFEQVSEYLSHRDAMNNFLELYQSFFTGQKSFEVLLKEAGTFLDGQPDLSADLKDYMRTEEDRQMLNGAFTNFLTKWNTSG
ncbi:hypothetical protein P171DRAFT_488561 [Karstenula rhodostoma CBS 690.94]|uniref:Zn(2)-C6 fungal-type domain-containing protein n=1 Tax=Karstenula rhodostoma CBS 690.94 TaxID=1392251 RepID=A0A9P4PCS0_9PLEO|nr:hypothetical protein P171DRAFT_488561 [Karstenula rhodostoma CBS 690.94]